MKSADIRVRIESMVSHFLFQYNGAACGVDPLSKTSFNVWCGSDAVNMKSIKEVMFTPFFFGKALAEIADDIVVISE